MCRPKTRADCKGIKRPCPYVSCKYNTYLDIEEDGSIIYNFHGLEPHEVPCETSCALDAADGGGLNLDKMASVYNLSREWMRLLIKDLIRKISRGE